MSDENKGGRPPLSPKNETLNILVPEDTMKQVRKVTQRRAATIAGWVRQAIDEKLEREQKQEG